MLKCYRWTLLGTWDVLTEEKVCIKEESAEFTENVWKACRNRNGNQCFYCVFTYGSHLHVLMKSWYYFGFVYNFQFPNPAVSKR